MNQVSFKEMLWKRGDWAGYFGLLANNLTNLLTMASLLLFVVGFPDDLVYGRVVPAFGPPFSLRALPTLGLRSSWLRKRGEPMSRLYHLGRVLHLFYSYVFSIDSRL